jgi:hypothetical protein
LKTINTNFYENEAMFCYLNDENGRDAQARIEKTFKNGRFSREKKNCCKLTGE